MNEDKMGITAVWSILLILILSITTFQVVDRVLVYQETEMEYLMNRCDEQGWSPPAIPQCDKPLWDRIREGCDNG